MEIGVKCAECDGEIYMTACPEHHWTVSSECLNCGSVYVVASKCKECDYPFNN